MAAWPLPFRYPRNANDPPPPATGWRLSKEAGKFPSLGIITIISFIYLGFFTHPSPLVFK